MRDRSDDPSHHDQTFYHIASFPSFGVSYYFSRSILHGVDPLSYFSFQPVLHDWCNKGRGMCYPVCGMVHIKEPLMLIRKSSLCGGSGFPFSLLEWSLTICLTPYKHKGNVLSASLNKTFPSFLSISVAHVVAAAGLFSCLVILSPYVRQNITR